MANVIAEIARAFRRKLRECVSASEPLKHLANAEREVLLAARALLDAKIRWLEKLQEPPESEEQARQVPVQ